MLDPSVPVRPALRDLDELTALRAEVVLLRAELGQAVDDLRVVTLALAATPFAAPAALRITPRMSSAPPVPSPRSPMDGDRRASFR